MCRHGRLVFDPRGRTEILCTARKRDLLPHWYVEGKDLPERTPTFPVSAAPKDCKAYEEDTRRRAWKWLHDAGS